MARIDYNETFNINLTDMEIKSILNLTQPHGFRRIYSELENFNHKVSANNNARGNEKKHFDETLCEMKNRKEIKERIIKNQLALSLIQEKIVILKENRIDTINLNAMLAFELYITAEGNIDRYTRLYRAEEKKETAGNREMMNRYAKIVNILKNLKEKIYKEVGLERLMSLSMDYEEETILSHKDKCLL